MVDQKVTDRSELSEAPADGDLLHITDVSDTTDDASGTSKKISVTNLIKSYVEALTSYFNVSTDTLDDITAGSTNKHFTATDHSKLDGIATGAEVNPDVVSQVEAEAGTATTERIWTAQRVAQAIAALASGSGPDVSTGSGAPSSTPTTEGDIYVDTTNDNVWVAAGTASSSDWKQATGAGGGDLLAANNLNDVANAATSRTNLGVAIGSDVQAYDANLPAWPATVDATEVGYLNGVTSAIQTQMDGKEPTLAAASDTTAGKVELATAAETDTGTDATRAVTPDGLQGSLRNLRFVKFDITEVDTDVATGTGLAEWVAPFDGTIVQDDSNKEYFMAKVKTAGTTGTMVIDVNKNGSTIMTTNKLDIETTETTTTNAATQPDLTTTTFVAGDVFSVDIDAIQTTAAQGPCFVQIAVRPD